MLITSKNTRFVSAEQPIPALHASKEPPRPIILRELEGHLVRWHHDRLSPGPIEYCNINIIGDTKAASKLPPGFSFRISNVWIEEEFGPEHILIPISRSTLPFSLSPLRPLHFGLHNLTFI